MDKKIKAAKKGIDKKMTSLIKADVKADKKKENGQVLGTSPVPVEQAHWRFTEDGMPYIWMNPDFKKEIKNESIDKSVSVPCIEFLHHQH